MSVNLEAEFEKLAKTNNCKTSIYWALSNHHQWPYFPIGVVKHYLYRNIKSNADFIAASCLRAKDLRGMQMIYGQDAFTDATCIITVVEIPGN